MQCIKFVQQQQQQHVCDTRRQWVAVCAASADHHTAPAVLSACALQAYAVDHGSSSNAAAAAVGSPGSVAIHTGSSSSSGNRLRLRPAQFNLGVAKAAGANAELPHDIVYSDAAATAAAEALLAESMRRGTMDNVTVIVMLLQWS